MNCPLCSSAQISPWASPPDGFRYWLCGDCRLVWLEENLRLGRAEEEARYRTHENFTDNAAYLSYLSRTALPVALLVKPGSCGLDYGCGPTEGMKTLLSPMGFSVDSYDPLFFPRADLLNFRYDFVLCSEAAEHFYAPGEEFDRINELLRPGGVLGVSSRLCVNQEEFPHWFYRRDPTHVAFYNRETVNWIARRFGWKVQQLDSPLWILQKPGG